MKLKKIKIEGNRNPMLLLGRVSFDNWVSEIKKLEEQYRNDLEKIKDRLSNMNRISIDLPVQKNYFSYPNKVGGTGYIYLSGDNNRGIDLYRLKGYGGYTRSGEIDPDTAKSENILITYRATQKELEDFIKEREKEKREYSCEKLNEIQSGTFENLTTKLYNEIHKELLLKSAKIHKDLFGRLAFL